MRRLLVALLFFSPPVIWGSEAEFITKHSLDGCTGASAGLHLLAANTMLKFIYVGRRVVEENPNNQEIVDKDWKKIIQSLSENLENLRVVNEKAAANRSENAKMIVTVRHSAANIALNQTFEEFKGTNPAESKVNEIFSRKCEAAVYQLTQNTRELERKLQEQFDREEREEARLRSERFLNLGLNLLSGSSGRRPSSNSCHNTSNFISGTYRTCYYQCPSGTVTSTIGAAEICALTKSMP